jgi:hypothetical protein
MKKIFTKNTSRAFTVLLALMFVFSNSCRKKEIEQNFSPISGNANTGGVANITNQPFQIMNSVEIAHKSEFPAFHVMKNGAAMSTLVGGMEAPNPFNEGFHIIIGVGDMLWKMHSQKIMAQNYAEVESQIAGIANQVTQLQTSINELSAEMQIVDLQLQNFINNMATAPYLINIDEAMDSLSPDGLLYFARMGHLIQTGQSTMDTNVLKQEADVFYQKYLYGSGNLDMKLQIDQLYDLICPATSLNQGVLFTFTEQCILENWSSKPSFSNPENVLKVYCLLENYFMQILNSQFEALLVISNIANKQDHSFNTFKTYYQGDFTNKIKAELDNFMQATNYLLINMVDFRTTDRYDNETTQYRDYGLAPDPNLVSAAARSEFLYNIINQALGHNPSTTGGCIIVGTNYGNESSGSLNNLTVNIGGLNVTNDANKTSIASQSQFPYASWAGYSPSIVSPDNHYNIYRYSCINQISNNSNIDIKVLNPFWFSNKPTQIGVTVTPLYYNPQYPDKAPSTIRTTTNCVQFAYFSASWFWGTQMLTMSDRVLQRADLFSPYFYVNVDVQQQQNVPCVVVYDDHDGGNSYFLDKDNTYYQGYFHRGGLGLSTFGYNGNIPTDCWTTGGWEQYSFMDCFRANITISPTMVSGGAIKIFTNAHVTANLSGGYADELANLCLVYQIGTKMNTNVDNFLSNSADLVNVLSEYMGTQYANTVQTSSNSINSGAYNFVFSWDYNYKDDAQYDKHASTTRALDFEFTPNTQVVYTGNYHPWQ